MNILKSAIAAIAVIGALTLIPSAEAQCTTASYVSAPVVVERPVYAAPNTAYHPPAPVIRYRPPTAVYRPVVPAAVVPAPAVYGRPVYTYYSPYGGTEVRVPGQPILNTLRAIVP